MHTLYTYIWAKTIVLGFRDQPTHTSGATSSHAASVCTEGDLRLEGGQNDMEGLVEVCLEGGWGTVCANANWQDIDATVACGQLGFSPNGMHGVNYFL